MCCDRLSLVYFPPFPFSPLLMMTVFPSPLPMINITTAPSPHLFQHNLSIPNLEEEKKKVFGSNDGPCSVVMWFHVHMLCASVCECISPARPGMCIIPRGYSYASHPGRKHINLSNTNSEKRSELQCVCQEAEDKRCL